MKKKTVWMFIVVAMLSGVVLAEEPVYFADAKLKARVEAELGISDPTPTDMLALTFLNAHGAFAWWIRDLTGLEYAANLTHLVLEYNRISNISALSGLTNLTVLDVGDNQISDISALAGLTKLTELYLYHNQISDISVLAGLTNLTDLELNYNQISDISALAGLANLTKLYLYVNQISNISPLSGLTNLTKLGLHVNQISNISPLSGLTNLTWLGLSDNQISDISALSLLENLLRLYLSINPLNCLAYDVYIPMIEANNPGIYLTYDPRPEYCDYQPDIDVSPVFYDFGDVKLFSSRTVLLTISNMGNSDLTINSIDLNPDSNDCFTITSSQILPYVIAPEDSNNVEITFAPTIEDIFSATLEISSDDSDEPVVQVDLVGAGVKVAPPVQIADILDFIDASVEDGIIVGEGSGNSANKKLNALINMFEATNDLIVGEYYDDACGQLTDILKKCDGQIPPPDFVSGQAVEELVDRILLLMEDIGCE